MSEQKNERRLRERLRLELPLRAHYRENLETEWTELTRARDLTPFGAGFSLTRPVDLGRLIHLTLPMPRQLRCFDHIEEQYRVWALVRSLRAEEPADASGRKFVVGAAFVGKHPPQSYLQDPTRRYEPAGGGDSLWQLKEQTGEAPRVERESRLNVPVEVTIAVPNERGEVAAREETVTENISRRGAAVFTTLDVQPGQFVRLTSTRYGTSVYAVVRRRRTGADGITRLHLQFVDREWPLEEFA